MHKILSLSLIIVFATILNGCKIKDEATSLKQDLKNSYNNVAEETTNVIKDINNKKKKAEETINDVQNALKEVEEAKSAIDEITK